MIELQHVSKTFETAGGRVDALKDVSLTIASGEILPAPSSAISLLTEQPEIRREGKGDVSAFL